MNTTNRPDPIPPATEPTAAPIRRTPALWVLLALLAIVLIGWYWLGKREAPAPVAPLPAPAVTEPAPGERAPDRR